MVSPQTPPPVASPCEPPSIVLSVSGGGPCLLDGAGVRRIKAIPLPARRWRRHVGPTVSSNCPAEHGQTPVEQVASVSQSFHDNLPSPSVRIIT